MHNSLVGKRNGQQFEAKKAELGSHPGQTKMQILQPCL